MVYKVALRRSEEGYSVTVPGLPGCCSQGATEAEALENIAEAIRDTSKSRQSWPRRLRPARLGSPSSHARNPPGGAPGGLKGSA